MCAGDRSGACHRRTGPQGVNGALSLARWTDGEAVRPRYGGAEICQKHRWRNGELSAAELSETEVGSIPRRHAICRARRVSPSCLPDSHPDMSIEGFRRRYGRVGARRCQLMIRRRRRELAQLRWVAGNAPPYPCPLATSPLPATVSRRNEKMSPA